MGDYKKNSHPERCKEYFKPSLNQNPSSKNSENFNALHFTAELNCFNDTFLSGNIQWIRNAIKTLVKYSRQDDIQIKIEISQSKAFQTLSHLQTNQLSLGYVNILFNITHNSPHIVFLIFQQNFFVPFYQSLLIDDDRIFSISLKALKNIIKTSNFSRIALVVTGLFSIIKKILMKKNRSVHNIRMLSQVTDLLISGIMSNTSNATEYDDDTSIIKMLKNDQIDQKTVFSLVNKKCTLNADSDLFYILIFYSSYNDSVVKTNGIKSLTRLSNDFQNADLIFNRTFLFEQCKNFCSRGSPELQSATFLLLSNIVFMLGNIANVRFVSSGLLEFIAPFCLSEITSVSLAAMKCISNYIPFNIDKIWYIFTDEFVKLFFVKLVNGTYSEREEALWIILNISIIEPSFLSIFENENNLVAILDFLEIQSEETVVMTLEALRRAALKETKVKNLLLQIGGENILHNLALNQSKGVSETALLLLNALSIE